MDCFRAAWMVSAALAMEPGARADAEPVVEVAMDPVEDIVFWAVEPTEPWTVFECEGDATRCDAVRESLANGSKPYDPTMTFDEGEPDGGPLGAWLHTDHRDSCRERAPWERSNGGWTLEPLEDGYVLAEVDDDGALRTEVRVDEVVRDGTTFTAYLEQTFRRRDAQYRFGARIRGVVERSTSALDDCWG